MSERKDPFASMDEFPPAVKPKVDRAALDQLAADNGFPSRQAPKPAPQAGPPKHVNIRFSQDTHAKMEWIKANVAGLHSIQRIVDHFLLDGIEQLLREHGHDQ